MIKPIPVGTRVQRVRQPHHGMRIPIGMRGVILNTPENPEVQWDNGKRCHSYLDYLEVVIETNRSVVNLLDKEW